MRPLSPPGRARLALAVAAALLAVVAAQAQAAGSASVTRVFYDPPSGPLPGCVAPLPAGGGSASASYADPGGAYSAKWEWTVPPTITAGATGRIKASIQVNTAGGAGAAAALKPPFEFGTNAGARQQVVAQVPVGAPGSATDEESYTFTPTRDFTNGEKLYIRLEIGCAAIIYEYTGSAASAAPTTPKPPRPKLAPRSQRPVPGVVTSYAAPRKGGVVVLPFPKAGCAPPAATTARETQAPAGGECSLDIFLRRKGGDAINDPEATFATDLQVSDANIDKGFHVCKILALSGPDDFVVRGKTFAQCVLVVARILQRDEDIRRRRGRMPSEHIAHAARGCSVQSARLAGASRRAAPAAVTCRRLAKGLRITIRSARRGRSVGSVVKPSSKLIVGRSGATAYRAGDRVDVLWTITPPRTTTTIRTPAPLAPGASPTAKVALTSAEAFPNGRTSNDPPSNAIDGNPATFTWSTEAYNVTHPSSLAVGFAEANVGRLRLWKERDGGGGELVKNLTIQYTTGTGPLALRTWANVGGLTNGVGGAELLRATAVNADGTVTGDVHNSTTGDGYASLTFTPVRATGLRIAFANPNPNTTCSNVPGTCNHYRVGELEAYAVP